MGNCLIFLEKGNLKIRVTLFYSAMWYYYLKCNQTIVDNLSVY